MTGKVNLLDNISKCHGTDIIIIGDVMAFPITGIDNLSIK